MRRLRTTPRTAWKWWTRGGLSVQVTRWATLAAFVGLATGITVTAVPAASAGAIGALGGVVTAVIVTRVAVLAQASEDRDRGLRLIAEQWMADTLRRGDERRREP